MLKKEALTSVEIDDIISNRWSPRAFDPGEPISRDQILSLCEAGRWAPSCFGDEPWRFLVWDRNENPEAFERAFNCLDPWNRRWVKNVPVLFLGIAYGKFRKNQKENRWGQYDTGAASENICLQAVSLGLAAHQMGGFDKDRIMEEFNIPADFVPMAMIAVGYQAEGKILEEEFQKLETADRKRRPIGSNFFDSEWEKPIG